MSFVKNVSWHLVSSGCQLMHQIISKRPHYREGFRSTGPGTRPVQGSGRSSAFLHSHARHHVTCRWAEGCADQGVRGCHFKRMVRRPAPGPVVCCLSRVAVQMDYVRRAEGTETTVVGRHSGDYCDSSNPAGGDRDIYV